MKRENMNLKQIIKESNLEKIERHLALSDSLIQELRKLSHEELKSLRKHAQNFTAKGLKNIVLAYA